MTIYLINVFLILLYPLILKGAKIKNSDKIIINLISIQFFVLMILRSTAVGNDNENYAIIFDKISRVNLWDVLLYKVPYGITQEYGYVLLNKLASMIFNDYQIMLYIVAIIIVVSVKKYIENNSKIPWLSYYLFVCLGFLSMSMNIYRQIIAIVILANSIQCVKQRNLWKFIAMVGVAFLIHKTAIVFLIIYPLSKLKINIKYILALTVMVPVLIFNYGSILRFIQSQGRIFYSLNENEITGENMFLLLIAISVIGLIALHFVKEDKMDLELFCHIMLAAVVLQMFALKFTIFGRLVYYFSFGMIILIPNIIDRLSNRITKVIGILSVCVLTLLFYIIIDLGNDIMGVVPYLFP